MSEIERVAAKVIGPHGMDPVTVTLPYAAAAWLSSVVQRAGASILAQEPVNAAFIALVDAALLEASLRVVEAINAEEGPPDA